MDTIIQMRNSKNTQKLYNEAYSQRNLSVLGFIRQSIKITWESIKN